MKKLLSLLLAILMLLSVALVSCGGNDNDNDKDTNDDLAFNETPSQDTDTPVSGTPDTDTPSTPTDYTFVDVDETVYVQNCNKVNYRTSPSSSADNNIEGKLTFGDGKSYKRVKYNEMWSGIEIDGDIYYVNTYFLTTSPAEVVFTDMSKTIYVNNIDDEGTEGNLYLRSFTSTNPDPEFYPDGNVAVVAKHGAPLEVTGISKNEKWYRVNFTDSEGKVTKNVYVYNGPYVSDTVPTGEPSTSAQTPSEPAVG